MRRSPEWYAEEAPAPTCGRMCLDDLEAEVEELGETNDLPAKEAKAEQLRRRFARLMRLRRGRR